MRSLSDTLRRLQRLPRGLAQHSTDSKRLRALGDFGSNPGQLKGWLYAPETAAAGAPLVVVLHGCTQNAADYDESAGWSRLAEQYGFMLLYPEQQRINNPNLCFNWFLPNDTARGKGEALSIRQMVETMKLRQGTDPQRIFITGLSAGGAMAATMLATYPEVFAGGAVIAGLPFGVANSVPEAFDRMRGHGGPRPEALAELVNAASSHTGKWPTLSVWHGTADQTVDQSNASAIIEQWRSLHGAQKLPAKSDLVNGHAHRVWVDPSGRSVIEEYRISGLDHGTPLDTRCSSHGEQAAPFMLDAGISSTRLISRFWGIVTDEAVENHLIIRLVDEENAEPRTQSGTKAWATGSATQTVIENALRRAGLMK